MAGPVFELEGTRALRRQLGRLEDAVAVRVLKNALAEGALPIRDDARRLAPRRTGHLARNIDIEVVSDGPSAAVAGIGPNKSAWYGIFPELGTKHQSAQPFLRPSFDANKRDALERINDRIRDELRRRVR